MNGPWEKRRCAKKIGADDTPVLGRRRPVADDDQQLAAIDLVAQHDCSVGTETADLQQVDIEAGAADASAALKRRA